MTADLNDYRARKAAARAYHPSVTPIAAPRDAITTAQDFHAVGQARDDQVSQTRPSAVATPKVTSKSRLFSVSRERRASRMDALAVALLMLLMAALGCIVMLASAPHAKADVDPEAYAYAAHYASAVCATLDDYPTVNGMLGIMSAITDDGLSDYQAGQVVGLSVTEACPRYIYLLDLFVAKYGGSQVA